MRFEITLTTAFLAAMVAASPYRQNAGTANLPKPILPADPNQPPTYADKDIKVTDYKYFKNGRKWWKTWTVDRGNNRGDTKVHQPSTDKNNPPPSPTYNTPKPVEKPPPPPTYNTPKPVEKPPPPPTYNTPKPVEKPPPPPTYNTPKPIEKPIEKPPPTTEAPKSDTKHGGIIDEILTAHNTLRAKHGSPPLVWSEELATFAKGVCGSCVFEHSGGKYGENLAAGSKLVPAESVNSWYNEVSKYPYGEPAFSTDWGHFSQVVWKSTTKVGCYLRDDCHDMPFGPYFLTCNYEIPGNMRGSYSVNVLPPGGGGY